MTPTTWNARTGPGPVDRAYVFARWLAATLALAWFAPFGLIAIFAAIGALFGVNAADVREEVIGFATLDASAWSSAGPIWDGYALACGLGMVAWRTLTARPVRELLSSWSTRAEAATSKLFEPVIARLERLPQAALIALGVAGIAVLASVIFLAGGGHDTDPAKRLGPPPPLPKPAPSAALTLPDGAIRSGAAMVEQRDPDTFVVVFKKEAAK